MDSKQLFVFQLWFSQDCRVDNRVQQYYFVDFLACPCLHPLPIQLLGSRAKQSQVGLQLTIFIGISIIILNMFESPNRKVMSPTKAVKQSTASTFYSSKRTHRQYYSLKKNFSNYSETTYSPSPSPDKTRQQKPKNSSVSPDRKNVYWQNWLLPQGIRKLVTFEQPTVSASSMCTLFTDTNQVFYSENSLQTRQMASLTKIMTAFTVISICNTYGVKIRETWIKIQKQAMMMEGTSANLRNDDELLVIDLLYGLLLPSGNDAGFSLAQYFGKFLSYTFAHENCHNVGDNEEGVSKFVAQKEFYDSQYKDESIKLFVFEMNKNAHKMGLKRTNFSNPTGLTDASNYSTAHDIALMISYCMKNHLMRSIMKKKVYICEAKNEKLAATRQIEWKNTNNHLFQIRDCIGAKTGITPGAGPCLSTVYRVMGRQLIVVLLNSKSLEQRYIDAEKLYKYARTMLQKQQQDQQQI